MDHKVLEKYYEVYSGLTRESSLVLLRLDLLVHWLYGIRHAISDFVAMSLEIFGYIAQFKRTVSKSEPHRGP